MSYSVLNDLAEAMKALDGKKSTIDRKSHPEEKLSTGETSRRNSRSCQTVGAPRVLGQIRRQITQPATECQAMQDPEIRHHQ